MRDPYPGDRAEPVARPDPRARVDVHAHTCFSLYDGVLTPRELVDAARAAGLAGVAVTDHYDWDDAWKGAFAARAYAESRGDLVVWPGLEYSVEKGPHQGHLLVYLDDAADRPPRGLSAGELLDHCEARGLLTIHPHPFSAWGIPDHHVIARSAYVELNGDHGNAGPNARVRREAFRHGWLLVAASDAHDPRQLGSAWTEVREVRPSLAETLASGARPVLNGAPWRGIAAKLARVAAAPVTLPWNAVRALAVAAHVAAVPVRRSRRVREIVEP